MRLQYWSAVALLACLPTLSSAGFVPGEILIKMKSGLRSAQIGQFEKRFKEMEIKVQYRYEIIPGLIRVRVPEDQSVVTLSQKLESLPEVEYAQPNFLRSVALEGRAPIAPRDSTPFPPIPAPEAPPTQWKRDPKMESNFGIGQNGTEAIWKNYTWGDPKTVIAIIDTGVDYTHDDIRANLWRDPKDRGVIGWNFLDNTNKPYDDYSHGTHVAGIAAAVGGNGIGISGHCPRCSIMALKFIGKSGEGSDADAIRAIEYAIQNHASVINASWGGKEYSQPLFDAFKKASEAGIVSVVAAGNEGEDNDFSSFYPANFQLPGFIAVAALYATNVFIPWWSNYGWWHVLLSSAGHEVYSTVPGNSYALYSGTSMAAPGITGSVGLIRSYRPDLTNAQVVQAFEGNVYPDRDSMQKVHFGGRPDMARIFAKLKR